MRRYYASLIVNCPGVTVPSDQVNATCFVQVTRKRKRPTVGWKCIVRAYRIESEHRDERSMRPYTLSYINHRGFHGF